MKKTLAFLLALILISAPVCHATDVSSSLTLSAQSAILIERDTGTILYEKDAHTPYEPASVTKVMTMLLIMEAIENGKLQKDDLVTTSAYAAAMQTLPLDLADTEDIETMGGSQVFLKEGEQFTVWEMLKCVAVVSGNDAAVALAEHLCGSEAAFVSLMNQRAKELGMEHTLFQNCTGLPAQNHVTTAYDIALMSRQLMRFHPDIRQLTTIWIDSIRDGEFTLSNTNRLVRFYNGATGLKTGSTASALFCLSASALREDMELIAVIMKAPTSKQRFADATALLDYGFANYCLTSAIPNYPLSPIPVRLGKNSHVQPQLSAEEKVLIEKGTQDSITIDAVLAPEVTAPVEKGQILGEVTVRLNGETLRVIPLIAANDVARLTFWDVFRQMLASVMPPVSS